MDKDLVPLGCREDSSLLQTETFVHSVEMERVDSDLSDEGHEGSSDTASGWGSLPHVCLRHVFKFLSDRDRVRASQVCHHWHHVMRSPSLWRYRFFYLSGRLSRHKQSEYRSTVEYVHSLGVYLERLEVYVRFPDKSVTALRLKRTICDLFTELTRVKAPLRSLTLVKLELDRSAWTAGLKNSIVNSLIHFFYRGSAKLTTVCLNRMRNNMRHGLELLSALSCSQRRHLTPFSISTLDLRGFFSGSLRVHPRRNLPDTMRCLPGLTHLGMSYFCLSDELLTALQHRNQGPRQLSSRDGNTLQTFSLHCSFSEPQRRGVSGDSWAALTSCSPDLKVKLTVDQVIDTDLLARILQREIPLVEFSMTAFYLPDEFWSAKPLLSNMLPRYRCSLQCLTLDLVNCNERLDEELLELITACECLRDLKIWAFLEVSFVARLLHARLTQMKQLNKIRVRIYSENDTTEKQEQLEELLFTQQQNSPELNFYAIVFPFVVS